MRAALGGPVVLRQPPRGVRRRPDVEGGMAHGGAEEVAAVEGRDGLRVLALGLLRIVTIVDITAGGFRRWWSGRGD